MEQQKIFTTVHVVMTVETLKEICDRLRSAEAAIQHLNDVANTKDQADRKQEERLNSEWVKRNKEKESFQDSLRLLSERVDNCEQVMTKAVDMIVAKRKPKRVTKSTSKGKR